MPPYVTASRLLILVGVIVVLLAAFGIQGPPGVRLFEVGVGICFAAALVP